MDVSFSALRLTCPPIPPSPRFTPGRSRRLRGPPVGAFPGGFPGGTCCFGRGAASRWWNPPPPRRIGDRGIHEPQLLCFAAVGNSTRELRSSIEETDRLTIDEDCREADNKTKDRKLHPDNSDGEKMVKVCDKLIEVFMVDKPRTTDWRNLLAFSREWSNIRPHFFRRCQERADAAEDPEMKHKLHRLRRKLKEIDEDVQRHNELLGVVKAAPSEISKIVSRRRKDFTKEFFMHVHAVAESYYENPAEQNALVGLRNACLAALEAYDAVSESIEALNFAELKFQDIINSPSLDVARKKIDSLAEKKELDSALMLMMTKAWAGAKDSTMMKDEAKDILYHLYLTGTANLQRLVPKDIRILKYLLKVEDPEEQLCALRDAFTPGVELEGEDIDTLCTTPEKLFTWIITVLNAYHFGGEGTLIREARGLMNPNLPPGLAMAACGSLHLAHGSIVPHLHHTSPPRGAPTRPLAFAAGLSSSDLHRGNGGERCETSRRRATEKKRALAPARAMTDDRVDLDENAAGIISGEWPENFSLLSYDDLRAYLETQIVDDQLRPALLGEVMSTKIRAARLDQTLEEIDHHFEFVSGLPVVDHELRCVGVISKNDRARAQNGLKSKVREVMSSPAVTLTPDKTVMDAAALMLKMKIHRIPVLNKERQVIGMVTRTDIFEALVTVAVRDI